jgi:metallo-beta-lactamase family protein
MALRVSFCGGAETVTGSNFLVESAEGKLLIDCGIEQGSDFSEARAYAPFPYDPKSIDALAVTHAHLDHVGLIPKLVKDGFAGKIYMTPATRDLAELILHDSIGILKQDADRRGIESLYEAADVDRAITLIEPLAYHTEKLAAPGLSIYLRNTGHILGSASVRVRGEDGAAMAFTGDIGNSPSPYLPDPEPILDAAVILMESVYGDRLHPDRENRTPALREAMTRAIARGGAILMPAFSMERTQLMLYELADMFEKHEVPNIPVFLDSPLAIAVTDVYKKYENTDYFNHRGDLFNFPFVTRTPSREDSKAIEEATNPKLIVAGPA